MWESFCCFTETVPPQYLGVVSGLDFGHFFFFNVCFFVSEQAKVRKQDNENKQGGAETEGDTDSKEGSRLWTVSTNNYAELKLTTHEIVTWAEGRHLTDWATRHPRILTILVGMSWYLIFVFNLHFPDDFWRDNHLKCSFAIWLSSLVRWLFRPLAYISIGLFAFLMLSFKSSLYISYVFCKYFLPVSCLLI